MKSYKYDIKCTKQEEFESVKCNDSKTAYDYAKKLWGSDLLLYESCFILLLDHGGNITGWAKISQGGIAISVMDVRIVCKYAIETLASGVILLHNHPSGSLNASEHDKKTTKRIKEALNILEIQLLDHLIITENSYFSFNDECIL